MTVCLQSRHSLRLPSTCSSLRVIHSFPQLRAVWLSLSAPDKCIFLGSGSNVVLPRHHPYMVLQNAISGIRVVCEDSGYVDIEVGSGVIWHDLVRYCMHKGWYGIENLALIPGTVGAAPVQNIGAYGVEIADVLQACEVWDKQDDRLDEMDCDACGFGYRTSVFKRDPLQRLLITKVRLRLHKSSKCDISYSHLAKYFSNAAMAPAPQDVYQAVMALRRERLPDWHRVGTVGSFFVNPVVDYGHYMSLRSKYSDLLGREVRPGHYKLFAGQLLGIAGWRGYHYDGVGSSWTNPLVLLHYGDSCREKLLALAQTMRRSVQCMFAITLEIEPVVYH